MANFIPVPTIKPEPPTADIAKGASWFDSIYNYATGAFKAWSEYDISREWVEWQKDEKARAEKAEAERLATSLPPASYLGGGSNLFTYALFGLGAIIAIKMLK